MREKVIRSFIDKETKEPYNVGDFYKSKDKSRINELREKGFLYKPEEKKKEYPIDKGSGWYELSNGEKIQGEEKAEKAQKELNKKG